MLDYKYKILFINSDHLTFIVFKIIENKIIVLFNFSQQIDLSNFGQQVMNLLKKATSFLNEIIDEINVIFDEPNISQINFANAKISNCHSLEEAKEAIIVSLNNENCYVNEIAIKNLVNNNGNINCDYTAFITKYEKYKYYIETIKQCHIKIACVSNIYNLLFIQNTTHETFVKITDKQIIIGKYENGKLIDIKTTFFDIDYLHTKIAKFFKLSTNKIKTMLALLDKTIVNVNEDIKIATNFISPTPTLNFIRASTLLHEFNFYFTKELERCFALLNFSLETKKHFVGANQYNNLIKFITKNKFSSPQQNFNFTWLKNLTVEQKISINSVIKINEKKNLSTQKCIPKNDFIFSYFSEK